MSKCSRRSSRLRCALLVNLWLGVSTIVFSGAAGAAALELVSRVEGGQQFVSRPNGSETSGLSISADGRFVAYQSDASNLADGDTNDVVDIFVHDRETDTTQILTAGGNAPSVRPSISADGRFVAFESAATNLVSGDSNVGLSKIFVYDRDTNTIESITSAANDDSRAPSISPDGRFVAFESRAINLAAGATTAGVFHILVYDREIGTIESLTRGGGAFFAGTSISANGRFVAFLSAANDLVPGDDIADIVDVFVYDRDTDSIELLTAGANRNSQAPSISPDGRWVVFDSQASTLVDDDPNFIVDDIFVYDRDTDSIELITRGANSSSNGGAISADGRYVAFTSTSGTLVSVDTAPGPDVFLFDRNTDTLELVTAGGNDRSPFASISADGQVVAFTTSATNLIQGEFNRVTTALAFDRATSTFERLESIEPRLGFVGGNGGSHHPAISANGRFVAFDSGANDLGVEGTQRGFNPFRESLILVFDRITGTNQILTAGANGDSQHPSISADGEIVAFDSFATNLVTADTNGTRRDVFVHNRLTGTTQVLTRGGDNVSVNPGVSADGRFVAFESFASNLVAGDTNGRNPDILVYDLQTNTTEILTAGGNSVFELGEPNSSPALSADGRFVAFSSTASNLAPGDTNGDEFDIYVYDRETDTIELLTAGGNARSIRPSISADGRFVVFESVATNLVAEGSFGTDLFLHDRNSGITSLLTATLDDGSFEPSMSADGRFIAFHSFASNLADGSLDGETDVFVLDRETNSFELLTQGADGASRDPSISEDGQSVAFYSTANTLTGDGTFDVTNVFVSGANEPPSADPLALFTNEDTAVEFTVTGFDPEGDVLSFAIVSPPDNGELSGAAPDFVYTPNSDFFGTDSFTFQSSDGSRSSPPASVSISVTSVNDAPAATGTDAGTTEVTTLEDTAVAITLAGTDIDDDSLTYSVTTLPDNGTFSGTAPNLIYTPVANFNGSDQFSYTVSDGALTSSAVTISLTVVSSNDLPVANPQSLATLANTPLPITLIGGDSDNDALIFAIVGFPANGTISGDIPNLLYTPNSGFTGSDSLAFTVSDGTNTSPIATVSVQVSEVVVPPPENVVPVADNQSLSTSRETPVAISLTGSDADGDPLTFNLVAFPANGLLSGEGSDLLYTPNVSFSGSDSFTFSVSDAQDVSATATVSISVIDTAVQLFSAVLPASRSVQVGTTATAFATLINAGSVDALGCELRLPESLVAEFFFQASDSTTNEVIGQPDLPVDIPAGAAQSFVFGITPSEALPATEIALQFQCENANAAASIIGLNTLLLSAAVVAVPDVIALVATVTNNGVMELGNNRDFFTAATVNIGSAATITVTADTGDANLPLTLSLCQTDPTTSACINPTVPAAEPVIVDIAEGGSPTFAVFANASGPIALDPANNRVFLRFSDEMGVVRGATSVAVQNNE